MRFPPYTAKFASVVLHELHLIHTDLKPENILLVNNDYQMVQVPTSSKVGKFGSRRRLSYTDEHSTVSAVLPPEPNAYCIQQTSA